MTWFNFAHASSFMPTEATNIAQQVDSLYGFLLIASGIACAILIGGMIYFAYKYKRRTSNDKTAYISHNTALEFLWSFIPLVIFLGVFGWGWHIYSQMRAFPPNALEVEVLGMQWNWEFQYKSGFSSDTLMVPVNRDIKLVMTSKDVLHSFYVPSFRIKQDVIPGRYTAIWFKAEKLGEFHVFCTEFCGTSHSGMLSTIKVVPQGEFDRWMEEKAKEHSEEGSLPLAQLGEKLFKGKACASCHSTEDATIKVGPSLFQKFGANENIEEIGSVVINEDYLKESILNPNAKVVKGFPKNVMPSFQGQLNDKQISALIEYIKGMK